MGFGNGMEDSLTPSKFICRNRTCTKMQNHQWRYLEAASPHFPPEEPSFQREVWLKESHLSFARASLLHPWLGAHLENTSVYGSWLPKQLLFQALEPQACLSSAHSSLASRKPCPRRPSSLAAMTEQPRITWEQLIRNWCCHSNARAIAIRSFL